MSESGSLSALEEHETDRGDRKLTIQGRGPRIVPPLGDNTAATRSTAVRRSTTRE